jgi:hypothetical protein
LFNCQCIANTRFQSNNIAVVQTSNGGFRAIQVKALNMFSMFIFANGLIHEMLYLDDHSHDKPVSYQVMNANQQTTDLQLRALA